MDNHALLGWVVISLGIICFVFKKPLLERLRR